MGDSVIKIATGRASVDIDGTNYRFPHCVSWTVTDPKENGLIASPQDETDGIPTENNLAAPCSAAGVLREIPVKVLQLLETCFKEKKRVRFTLYDSESGRQVVQDKSLIRQNPMNMAVAEGDDNFNVNIDFICTRKNQKHSFNGA